MNINMVLEMAAGGYGARGAVVTEAGEVSYEALHARVRARARAVAAVAAEAQVGHVAYLGLSGDSYIEHLLAAATAGLPFVPLNYRTRAEELAALLEPLSPVLLVHDPAYTDKALAAAGEHDVLLTPDALGTATDGELPAVDGDTVAVLLHTSGTTSAPKAVVLRHRHLCSYIFGVVEFGSAASGETALCTVPPYHIAGIMGVLTPLYAGRRLVFLPQFDATTWLEAAARHDVTHAFVVPTMLSRIVEVLDADPALRPASLRHIAYGGGPIHRALVERALTLLPEVDFVNAYGLTETSSTVALLSPDDHRAAVASGDPAVRARLGSVGRPLPGIEVRILDEHGDELPAGEVGIVSIAGPQVSGQYRGADAPAGCFMTGDLGHLDAGGYLFLGGRSDDVIIRGGENISPGEIEDVLARHPDARHVAVVGVPDEEWGQRVVAFVEPCTEEHVSGEELRDWARAAGLAGFKIPASVAFVDELPRNDTGKVLRRRLREAWVDDVPEPA